MRTPALWLLALATGMMFFMHAGSNTHAAAFFQDQGLGAVTAGVSISLNAIFLGISSLVWGRIVERVPARFVMAAVAVNLAIGAFLFTLTDTTIEALAFSALFGFGLGGMLVVPPVAYADYFGRPALGTIRGVTEPFTTLGPGCWGDDPRLDLRLCRRCQLLAVFLRRGLRGCACGGGFDVRGEAGGCASWILVNVN